jgi:hypothetical protein
VTVRVAHHPPSPPIAPFHLWPGKWAIKVYSCRSKGDACVLTFDSARANCVRCFACRVNLQMQFFFAEQCNFITDRRTKRLGNYYATCSAFQLYSCSNSALSLPLNCKAALPLSAQNNNCARSAHVRRATATINLTKTAPHPKAPARTDLPLTLHSAVAPH